MIIKGGAAGNVGFWSRHLMRDDTNEEVRLIDITGLMATNLAAALREMQAIARQSRSRGNFMYQASINPRAGEALTRAQMMEAVERLERNLRLTGHQRVIVEHVKQGRRHWHAIWNRVDAETLKVTDITGNYAIHARTARELEQAFGLRPTPSPDGKRRSREKLWERHAEKESGITREKITADLTRCWQATKTGRQFRDAIQRAGYLLARGDRRDFCVVDQSGRVHSLARRLDGVSTEEIRARLADIDPATLPSVAEARVQQRAANPDWRGKSSRKSAIGQAAIKAAKWENFGRHRRGTAGRRKADTSPNASGGFRAAMALTKPRGKAILPRGRSVPHSAKKLVREATRAVTQRQPARVRLPVITQSALADTGPVRSAGLTQMDASALARAGAAYDSVMAIWQARIDAAATDPSLSPEQRAAAMVALRSRQHLEATAARQRIIEEEKQRVRAARRAAQKPKGEMPKPK
jgi:Ni,Fe-hydrogenase III component G